MTQSRRSLRVRSVRANGSFGGPLRTESLEQRVLLTTYAVSSLADSGAGSLRQAILDANAGTGAATISFAGLSGTINLQSELPALNRPVVVDGTTAQGFAGVPRVFVDGAGISNYASGITLLGGNSTVGGLGFVNFQNAGIVVGSSNNVVIGNWIGLTSGGNSAGPNRAGVLVSPYQLFGVVTANRIGGVTAAERNIISGNDGPGIWLSGAEGTQVLGNWIGTNAAGNGPLPNRTGVVIDPVSVVVYDAVRTSAGSDNVIGGPGAGAGNRIQFNNGPGVVVNGGLRNVIRGNSIDLNQGLGIDLRGDGVTPNDPADPDAGPNLLQNTPLVGGVSITATSISVGGVLNSTPSTAFTIDFYASPTADPSGSGQGRTYLGSTTITTSATGDAGFGGTFPVVVPAGSVVTATATDPTGNTSEFSNAAAVPPVNSPATFQWLTDNVVVDENGGSVRLTVVRTGNLATAASVSYATAGVTAGSPSDYRYAGGTLSFAAGETVKTITIGITNDQVFESLQTFRVALSNPVNGAVGGTGVTTVTIRDDDFRDRRFRGSGQTTTTFQGTVESTASAVIPLAGGKTLVGGTSGGRFALAQFNADGTLDTTFGTGGRVTTVLDNALFPEDRLVRMLIQSDGKIVAAGTTTAIDGQSSRNLVVRYNPNGSLDTTFGTGGIVRFALNTAPGYQYEGIVGLGLQSDGKLVFTSTSDGRFTVGRLLTSGASDTTFGTAGVAKLALTTNPNSSSTPAALLVQADDKIVVVGQYSDNTVGNQAAALRLNANGTLDTTFDGDGLWRSNLASQLTAVAIAPGSKLIFAGSIYNTTTFEYDTVTIRVTTAGALDTTFNSVGSTKLAGGETPFGIAVRPDGRIAMPLGRDNTGFNTKVVQYTAAGALDTTFSGDGIYEASFTDMTRINQTAVQVLSTGQLLVVGGISTSLLYPAKNDFLLSRLTTTGAVDTTFSGDGLTTARFTGNLYATSNSSVVQSDGKLVVLGILENQVPGLARYNVDGTLDSTFGQGGRAQLVGEYPGYAHRLLLQSNGKFLVLLSGNDVIRVNSNGTLDTTFGSGGRLGTNQPDGLAIQSDGKLLVLSQALDNLGAVRIGFSRYSADGVLDSTYGVGGSVTTNVAYPDSLSHITLSLQSGNRPLVTEALQEPGTGYPTQIRITRFTAAGALDVTFNATGQQLIGLPNGRRLTEPAVAVKPTGEIVVAANEVDDYSQRHFNAVVTQLTANGAPDATFGPGGQRILSFGPPEVDSIVGAVLVQPDGRVVIAGDRRDPRTRSSAFATVRLMADGTVDTTYGNGGVTLVSFAGARVQNVMSVSRDSTGNLFLVGDVDGTFAVAKLLGRPATSPYANLSFGASSYSVNEDVGTATITVVRSGDTTSSVTAQYNVLSHNGTVGSDVAATFGTLTFAPGETTKTFTIQVINDTRDETDEMVSVILDNLTGNAQLINPAPVWLTIVDDDPAPTISVNNVTATEGNSGNKAFTFTVSLSAASGRPVSVKYLTNPGTATAGTDYTSIPLTTLTFNPGETSKTVTVQVRGDTTNEPNETFFLDLSAPVNATIAAARGTATIENDDAPPAPVAKSLTASSGQVVAVPVTASAADELLRRVGRSAQKVSFSLVKQG